MKQKTNAAEENKNKREVKNNMTKEEFLKIVNALKANAVTLDEMAEAIGQKNRVVTKEHLEAVKIVNSMKELGLKNPIADVKIMQDKIKADSKAVLNAQLDKEFGTNPNSDKKVNLLRIYAEQRLANIEGKNIEEKIENIKKDPIALNFAKEKTDYNSDLNSMGIVEEQTNINNDTDAIVIDKL